MDTLSSVLDLLFDHPGLLWMVFAMIMGQFFKVLIFTKARATSPGHFRWFWVAGRKSLPWHPVFVGVLIGAFWKGPIETHWEGGTIWAMIYFGVFGGLAVWAFEAVRQIAMRYEVDLVAAETLSTSLPPPGAPPVKVPKPAQIPGSDS